MAKSNIVPYLHNETGSDRHARRLDANLKYIGEVKTWCDQNHVELRITNGGHHWTFKRRGHIAEWWPSSAKLVYGREYRKESHLHDYAQVLRSLRRWVRRMAQ